MTTICVLLTHGLHIELLVIFGTEFWIHAMQNELAILEFIHCVVETMDRYFGNVVSAHLLQAFTFAALDS
jgi:hypothetical protein